MICLFAGDYRREQLRREWPNPVLDCLTHVDPMVPFLKPPFSLLETKFLIEFNILGHLLVGVERHRIEPSIPRFFLRDGNQFRPNPWP